MVYRELTQAEYSDLESRILYEDNHLLIINKMRRPPCHPD